MTKPLDFSAGARKPVTPPPPQQKAPRTPGTKKRNLAVAAGILVVAAFLAIVVFDVFGDSSGGERGITRYCRLSAEVDAVALQTAAASAPGAFDGKPEAISAAGARLGDTLKELRDVAPRDVRADVKVVTDALERAAAGNADAVKEPAFAASAQRASVYRSQSCAGGQLTGD